LLSVGQVVGSTVQRPGVTFVQSLPATLPQTDITPLATGGQSMESWHGKAGGVVVQFPVAASSQGNDGAVAQSLVAATPAICRVQSLK